jgi:hypothetical protein
MGQFLKMSCKRISPVVRERPCCNGRTTTGGEQIKMPYPGHEKRHNWLVFRFTTYEKAKAFADARHCLTVIRLAEDDRWEVLVNRYIKAYKN